MRFEASRAVFLSLLCYKVLKLITKVFTSRTLPSLLIHIQHISLRSLGMHRKQKFEIEFFGFKSDKAVLTFNFAFSPPLFFRFPCPIFFLLLRIQQASFWCEKFLGKLLGSQDQMKGKVGGQWNKIFMEIFRSMLHGFLPFSLVSLTELCSFWYGLKDVFTLHKLVGKVVLDH